MVTKMDNKKVVDINKLKVMSVLIFPFQNRVMIRVTRAEGYFTYPQKVKEYSVEYTNPRFDSFYRWATELNNLNLKKIVKNLRGY